MSFGAGFIQDMNNRINQNRKLRGSNKPKFRENVKGTLHSFEKEEVNSANVFKTNRPANKKLMAEIRANAKKEQKRRLYLNIGYLLLGILIFMTLMILINRPL